MREEPAEPRPSSTVILLREERGGFSVLMLERHGNIAFPGAHVFPGGIVEPSDTDACGALLPSAQEWAAASPGLSSAWPPLPLRSRPSTSQAGNGPAVALCASSMSPAGPGTACWGRCAGD